MLMATVITVKQCSKLWLATITSAHAKKGEIGGEKWIC